MSTNRKLKRGLFAKFFLIILSLILLLFIISFAWFKAEPEAHASGLSAKCSKASGFEGAIAWSNSKTLNEYFHTNFTKDEIDLYRLKNYNDDVEVYSAFEDYQILDITSDGANFIRPAGFSNRSSNPVLDVNSSGLLDISKGVDYLWFDYIAKSDVQCTLKLNSLSYLKGGAEETAGDGGLVDSTKGNNQGEITRKSEYGNFSQDGIVGAMRVSFVPASGFTSLDTLFSDDTVLQNSASLVWLPRPEVLLNTTDQDNNWTLSDWSNPSTHVTLSSNPSNYMHNYYSYNQSGNPYFVLNSISPSDNNLVYGSYSSVEGFPQISSEKYIMSCDTLIDGYYYGKMRVYIWLEGTDIEARKAMVGGKFSLGFTFTN